MLMSTGAVLIRRLNSATAIKKQITASQGSEKNNRIYRGVRKNGCIRQSGSVTYKAHRNIIKL